MWRLAKLRKIRLRGVTDPAVKEATWPRMIVTAGPIAKSPMAIMANAQVAHIIPPPRHKSRNAGGYCQKANDEHIKRLLEEGATRASLQSSSLKVCPQCPHGGRAELHRQHLAERHADGGESKRRRSGENGIRRPAEGSIDIAPLQAREINVKSGQRSYATEGDPADTSKLLKSRSKIDFANLHQQDDEENAQGG